MASFSMFSLALCVGVMVQTLVSTLARRPELAAFWKFLPFSLNRLYVHVLHLIHLSICRRKTERMRVSKAQTGEER